jgi:hypothetical protein
MNMDARIVSYILLAGAGTLAVLDCYAALFY